MAGSNIDATVPADNVKVDKALIRTNFLTAKSEISAVQRRVGAAWQMVLGSVSMTTL